jgi:hypothetical protein
MFVIVSGNGGGGSPGRNAPIADANPPETINFNGVLPGFNILESLA